MADQAAVNLVSHTTNIMSTGSKTPSSKVSMPEGLEDQKLLLNKGQANTNKSFEKVLNEYGLNDIEVDSTQSKEEGLTHKEKQSLLKGLLPVLVYVLFSRYADFKAGKMSPEERATYLDFLRLLGQAGSKNDISLEISALIKSIKSKEELKTNTRLKESISDRQIKENGPNASITRLLNEVQRNSQSDRQIKENGPNTSITRLLNEVQRNSQDFMVKPGLLSQNQKFYSK